MLIKFLFLADMDQKDMERMYVDIHFDKDGLPGVCPYGCAHRRSASGRSRLLLVSFFFFSVYFLLVLEGRCSLLEMLAFPWSPCGVVAGPSWHELSSWEVQELLLELELTSKVWAGYEYCFSITVGNSLWEALEWFSNLLLKVNYISGKIIYQLLFSVRQGGISANTIRYRKEAPCLPLLTWRLHNTNEMNSLSV